MASANTSDHQPMPMQPTFIAQLSYGFGSFAGYPLVELPVTAGHADAADAFFARHDRPAAFHRGPALRAGGEGETERMRGVESLSHGTLRSGAALVRRRAHRLGGGRMHGMELAAFHALEQHQVAAGVDNRNGHRQLGFPGKPGRGLHDLARTRRVEPFAVRDVHRYIL